MAKGYFEIRPFPVRTTSWWFDNRDRIDMEPEYQRRGGLWGPKQKSFLIDSILNDFDIPKIYIADFTYRDSALNTGERPYAIIDGKQRLEAIFAFFMDTVELDRGFVYNDEPELALAGSTLSDLRERYPAIASKVENYNLTVASVITDDEAKINDLFVRLNTSKPLTGAEVRNAMRGVLPVMIRNISSHPLFTEFVRFSISRGQDRNAAAKLLLIEFLGSFTDTKRRTLDRFVEEGLRIETTNLDRAASRVTDVLDEMTEIFREGDPLLRSQGVLPLYYWLVRLEASRYGIALREFLEEFEALRKSNRATAREFTEGADQELLLYDTLNRSTDDESSYQIRFRVLLTRFHRYLAERPAHSV